MAKTDPGLAVSLGSSFLGYYAHSGFLCGLDEIGINPGHISGSSAGAMAGGFYASGFRGKAFEEAILAKKLKSSFADPALCLRWIPMLFTGRVTGFLSGKGTVQYLREHLPVSNIDECEDIKLSISVTDLRAFQSHCLQSGPLAEAIVASCSVPILFSEQEISGKKYYDGGILHETPIDHLISNPDIHTIIIHRVTSPKKIRRGRLHLPDIMGHSHQMICDELLTYRTEEAKRQGKQLILVETEHNHPGLFQRQKTKKQFFNKGFKTAIELKEKISPPSKKHIS